MQLLQVLYLLPKLVGANVVVGMVRSKDIALHEKRFGATVLNRHSGESYGGKYEFATVVWLLDQLTPSFFKLTGCQQLASKTQPIYHPQQWNQYAASFGSVQTSFQRELQFSCIDYLHGDVADFGCGTAKIAPLLADNRSINSYTGIDYSAQMVCCANDVLSRLNRADFIVWQGKIEDYGAKQFDSAVSINSFYSWPAPDTVLAHIFALLRPGATLVLATPNQHIKTQMPNMLREVERELFLHPHWSVFKQSNLAFVDNAAAHFIAMDELVERVQAAGFAIQSCHQSFYLGALNFMVLKKKSNSQNIARQSPKN
jgi:SAM-dependent methyltransferase